MRELPDVPLIYAGLYLCGFGSKIEVEGVCLPVAKTFFVFRTNDCYVSGISRARLDSSSAKVIVTLDDSSGYKYL